MFSFWPQLFIVISVVGIIVILLRKAPGASDSKFKIVLSKVSAGAEKILKELWHFILEVKAASKIRSLPQLPKRLPKIHFPKAAKLIFRTAESPEFFLAEAQKSLEREDVVDAERKLIKAIEKDPKSENAYSMLGKLYLSQKKYEEAIETFKFLVKHFGGNSTYWSNLGQAYHGYKLYDQAVDAYEQSIELEPDNGKRYLNLGLTLEAKKHLEEAILNYRKALDLEKNNTHFMLVLAEALTSKGEREEAEMLLEQILQAEPTNHSAREKLMQLKF